jgi:hypothetical protein
MLFRKNSAANPSSGGEGGAAAAAGAPAAAAAPAPAAGGGGGGLPSADAFYFRLNDKYLYYTESSTDQTIVLGAIKIVNIYFLHRAGPLDGKCIQLRDDENDDWILCSVDENRIDAWACAIKDA